uniref:Uncharacterized protein n=1 Tax=Lepeophtheirus salmonis TaxID=72036 RepID=A0A0K2VH71_LEPSM
MRVSFTQYTCCISLTLPMTSDTLFFSYNHIHCFTIHKKPSLSIKKKRI